MRQGPGAERVRSSLGGSQPRALENRRSVTVSVCHGLCVPPGVLRRQATLKERPLCAPRNVRRAHAARATRDRARARRERPERDGTLKTKRVVLVQYMPRGVDTDAADAPGRGTIAEHSTVFRHARVTTHGDTPARARWSQRGRRPPSRTIVSPRRPPTAARARRSRPRNRNPCKNDAMRVPVSPQAQPRTCTLAERNARGHTLLFNLISPRLPVLNNSRPPSREAP